MLETLIRDHVRDYLITLVVRFYNQLAIDDVNNKFFIIPRFWMSWCNNDKATMSGARSAIYPQHVASLNMVYYLKVYQSCNLHV